MSETPLDKQDRRMPEPTLIDWLRDQQRIFDVGGASKDRRPELAATLLERVIRQRDEATLEVCKLKKNCQCCRDALTSAREAILISGGIEDKISPENELRAEISKLKSQLEEARAALKPFADYADCKCDCCNHEEDVIAGPVTNDLNFTRVITMGDLRQARSALEASNKGAK